MNNSYVIQWKSKSNGRAGRGTKRFEKEEADRLVQELNHEYPEIEHEAVLAVDEPAAEPVIPNPAGPILSLA
ncbi:MAG TPA: hypothetical protein VHC44_17750 [Verrucomicrobiae bacterium]|nr:hypothetical protein [Verrucomicrobiae bacterium]